MKKKIMLFSNMILPNRELIKYTIINKCLQYMYGVVYYYIHINYQSSYSFLMI